MKSGEDEPEKKMSEIMFHSDNLQLRHIDIVGSSAVSLFYGWMDGWINGSTFLRYISYKNILHNVMEVQMSTMQSDEIKTTQE